MRFHFFRMNQAALIALLIPLMPGGAAADMLKLVIPAVVARSKSEPPPSGPHWRAPQLLENEEDYAYSPDIVSDAQGNAVAFWRKSGSGTWCRRYAAGAGWTDAGSLGGGNSVVSMNPAGSLAVVWSEYDANDDTAVYAKICAAADSCGEIVQISGSASFVQPQSVVMDAAGNAAAFWTEGMKPSTLWTNRYEPGAGWGAPIQIESSSQQKNALAAADASGNVLIVWEQRLVNTFYLAARRYEPGAGWGESQLIEPADPVQLSNSTGHRLAADAAGNVIAVWQRTALPSVSGDIWANRYEPGAGWGTAQLIETDAVNGASAPDVAADAAGNAVAVWQQFDGSRLNIWTASYTLGAGWSVPQLLETNDAGDTKQPQIAINAAGDAVAVWQQHDGSRWNIWAARFTPGAGWQDVRLIEANNTGDAQNPQVMIDADGKAVAVWEQDDGEHRNIWAARYE